MSQEKPTPQNNDEPRAFDFDAQTAANVAVMKWIDSSEGRHRLVGCTPSMIVGVALQAYRESLAAKPSTWMERIDIGRKGAAPKLPNAPRTGFDLAARAANRAEQAEQRVRDAEAELAAAREGLDKLAPGASEAAQKGIELANRHIGYVGQDSAAALAAALELIGKQTDVVAVQLPEPDANIANPTWIIDEPGFGTQVRVNRDSIDGCVRWGPVRFEDTAEVREFAAALLAAANVADAAEDGAQ